MYIYNNYINKFIVEYKQQAIVENKNSMLGYELLASKIKIDGKEIDANNIVTTEWELISKDLVSKLENFLGEGMFL